MRITSDEQERRLKQLAALGGVEAHLIIDTMRDLLKEGARQSGSRSVRPAKPKRKVRILGLDEKDQLFKFLYGCMRGNPDAVVSAIKRCERSGSVVIEDVVLELLKNDL